MDNTSPSSPRIDHACRWLESRLGRPELLATGKLPPVRTLAAEAGVALVTMHKAIHRLCEAGTLRTIKGRGIWLSEALPPTHSSPMKHAIAPRWRRIRDELLERIHSGVYTPARPLPSIGVLQEELGASYRTVRKALSDLEDKGAITPCKRTFRPVPIGDARAGAALLIITIEDGQLHPKIASRRDEVLLGSLERGCSQARIRPVMIGLQGDRYTLSSAQILKRIITETERYGPILGAVVRIGFIQSVEPLLDYLLSLRMAVAVIDEFGDFTPELKSRYCGRLALFNVSFPPTAGTRWACFWHAAVIVMPPTSPTSPPTAGPATASADSPKASGMVVTIRLSISTLPSRTPLPPDHHQEKPSTAYTKTSPPLQHSPGAPPDTTPPSSGISPHASVIECVMKNSSRRPCIHLQRPGYAITTSPDSPHWTF
jgi:DNA-binding transcriptional regulator YhcF (GntR family)